MVHCSKDDKSVVCLVLNKYLLAKKEMTMVIINMVIWSNFVFAFFFYF